MPRKCSSALAGACVRGTGVNIRFLPAASVELEEAAGWYEDRQTGLGDRFIKAASDASDFIVQSSAAIDQRSLHEADGNRNSGQSRMWAGARAKDVPFLGGGRNSPPASPGGRRARSSAANQQRALTAGGISRR